MRTVASGQVPVLALNDPLKVVKSSRRLLPEPRIRTIEGCNYHLAKSPLED